MQNDEMLAKSVEKLWNEGYSKELMYFGLQCADGAIKGYDRGILKGALISSIALGCLMGIGYLIKKRVSEKK